MKIALYLLVFVNYIYAFGLQAESHIFACIKNENYDCIKRESELNQRWASKKNHDGDVPLSVAIKMKNSKIIAYLVALGSRVHKEHILLAMSKLFNVYPFQILNKSHITNLKKPEHRLIKRLIISAKQSEDAENAMIKLAQILDLVGEPEDIALVIKYLYEQKKINSRMVRVLMREYQSLFIQDITLSKKQLEIIVSALINLKTENNLLLLIIESFKTQKHNPAPRRAFSVNNSYVSSMVDEFAEAIISKSQSLFQNATPKAWVSHVFIANNQIIKDLIEYSEKLSHLVKISITTLTDPTEQEEKYIFWNLVLDKLISESDFYAAFAVATTLNASYIQKNISTRNYKENLVVSFDNNFKIYRSLLGNSLHKFHTLALSIHLHDLTVLRETGFFIKKIIKIC